MWRLAENRKPAGRRHNGDAVYINNRPYATISNMISKMRDNEIGGTFTVGQVLNVLQDQDSPTIQEVRGKEIGKVMTLAELKTALENSATFASFKKEHIVDDFTVEDALRLILESEELESVRDSRLGTASVTVGELIQNLLDAEEAQTLMVEKILHLTTVEDVLQAVDAEGLMEKYGDTEIGGTFTIGEAVDLLANNPDVQARRDQEITVKTSLGKVLDIIGEDKVNNFLEEKAAAASYNADYDSTRENVIGYWLNLSIFVFAFALLSTVTLEFIDKDKR